MLKWSKSWENWYRRALPAYWVFLFCATHFPKPRIPGGAVFRDWLLHLVAFAVLTFLFWRFAESFDRKLSGRFVWMALLVLGIYGGIDEYLQQFVGRETSLIDWLADLAGIILVLTPLELYRRLVVTSEPTDAGRAET